ncbi:hypothetical protein [Tardiphaga sp. 813_E8_N1_3]|uniref:hypothetical protein n=1 Tax=Tardiphaga sp. 813_E8_N1_3 TaxID=3240760 RepID=UPI003F21118A
MADYAKINTSHRLSSYEIKLPVWEGSASRRQPFATWVGGGQLPWYQAYNSVKHSRHHNFSHASFDNLISAACALVVLLSAQFLDEDGSPAVLSAGDEPTDGFGFAMGGYFLVRFPDDWPSDDRYDFNWQLMENDPTAIQSFRY